jgi:small subunit ribosomal protein S1
MVSLLTGGVDGLIHITDLSWSKSTISEVLELIKELNVVILDFDDEKTRIQLGLKQLNVTLGMHFNLAIWSGKRKVVVMLITELSSKLLKGVEGLIHVSEMSWSTIYVLLKIL